MIDNWIISVKNKFANALPHLVLDTLIEPAAQQGGGISPPQQDLLSDMVDKLYTVWVTSPSVIVGARLSINPLWLDFNVFMQFVSFVLTWSSAILFDAVNIRGILKKILLTPSGEAIISEVVAVTPLHCETVGISLDTASNMLEIFVLVFLVVLFPSPPPIW